MVFNGQISLLLYFSCCCCFTLFKMFVRFLFISGTICKKGQSFVLSLHYNFNYVVRYAKFIPRVYFLHKNQEQFPHLLFLCSSTQKNHQKNMPMHTKFINLPVLHIACIEKSNRLHKSVSQTRPKNRLIQITSNREVVLLILWY